MEQNQSFLRSQTICEPPKLSTELIAFLQDFHTFDPIVRNICLYLSAPELELIGREFAHKSDTWTLNAERELKTRTQISFFFTVGTRTQFSKHFLYSNVQYALFLCDCSLPSPSNALVKLIENYKRIMEYCMYKPTKSLCLAVHHFNFNPRGDFSEFPCFCGAIHFPHIPNIEIVHFTYGHRGSDYVWDALLSENEELECLLMFTKEMYPRKLLNVLDQQLSKIQPHKRCAIGGGTVMKMCMQTPDDVLRKHTSPVMYCIAFKANKLRPHDFYAASFIVKSNEHFEDRINFFKSRLNMKRECILFNLTCADKQFDHVTDENRLLKKVFSCPVICVDVDGEIGDNSFESNTGDEHKPMTKKKNKEYFHSFTSVLLYIGWG